MGRIIADIRSRGSLEVGTHRATGNEQHGKGREQRQQARSTNHAHTPHFWTRRATLNFLLGFRRLFARSREHAIVCESLRDRQGTGVCKAALPTGFEPVLPSLRGQPRNCCEERGIDQTGVAGYLQSICNSGQNPEFLDFDWSIELSANQSLTCVYDGGACESSDLKTGRFASASRVRQPGASLGWTPEPFRRRRSRASARDERRSREQSRPLRQNFGGLQDRYTGCGHSRPSQESVRESPLGANVIRIYTRHYCGVIGGTLLQTAACSKSQKRHKYVSSHPGDERTPMHDSMKTISHLENITKGTSETMSLRIFDARI